MSEIKLEIDNKEVSLIQGGEQNLKVTKNLKELKKTLPGKAIKQILLIF